MTERFIPHIREIFEPPDGRGSGAGGRTPTSRPRPLTSPGEPDLKHIDRHLSMKKTIRKKIMRDLEQAFVAERGEKEVEIKVVEGPGKDSFLEVLRRGSGGGVCEESQQGRGESQPCGEEKKAGFWRRFVVRRNKR